MIKRESLLSEPVRMALSALLVATSAYNTMRPVFTNREEVSESNITSVELSDYLNQIYSEGEEQIKELSLHLSRQERKNQRRFEQISLGLEDNATFFDSHLIDLEEYERRESERKSPGEIPLGQGSNQLELARLLYAEAREFWKSTPEIELIGSTVLTRKQQADTDLLDVIYDSFTFKKSKKVIHQYSCFNSNDINLKYAKNPLWDADNNPLDKEAWNKIYDISGNLIDFGPAKEVTHYWTSPTVKEPRWARGQQPVATINFNGKTTRFYNLGNNYKTRQRSPLIR